MLMPLVAGAHAGDVELKRVRCPDHDLLVELEACEREVFGEVGLRICDLAVLAQAGAVYLACVGGEIAGGCQLMRMVDEPGFFYVVGFYVKPIWQGKGLGRAMLKALEDEVRRFGGVGMVLTVAPDNVRALRLYHGAGFREESFVAGFYGEGEDRHVLRLRFKEGA